MDSPVAPAGRRGARPWIFGVASIPYGAFNGVVAVALPYFLRARGVSVDQISSIGAAVQAPAIWYFLWAPVVDVGLRRRSWVVLLSVASALCTAVALGHEAGSTTRLTTLLIVASVFNQPVSSAIGGLVADVMPNAIRGRTGGWSQAGILGGGVLAGGAAVWLADHVSATTLGIIGALFIGLPSFAVLSVNEPSGNRPPLRAHLTAMFREIVAVFRRRNVRLGLVWFLSPIGAGALMSLFTAVASDFHASSSMVVWVVAIAGVLTPLGALVGGFACDRFDRWGVYPVAGLLQAAAAGVMLVMPLTPAAYAVGAAMYAFATGFCYASFMALALELLGAGGAASGTQFTLFMAAVNLPVVYMLRLDGLAHGRFGIRGMLGTDAFITAAFALVLLLAVRPRVLARS